MWNIVFTILVILAVAIGYGWYYFVKKERQREQTRLRLATERQAVLDRWAENHRRGPVGSHALQSRSKLRRLAVQHPERRKAERPNQYYGTGGDNRKRPHVYDEGDTVTPFVTGLVVGAAIDALSHSGHSSSEDSGMRGGGGESDGGGASGSFESSSNDSGSSGGDSGGGGSTDD